jgi:hypothetical protein
MEIRKLKTLDVFKLTSIIRKIGVRQELTAVPKPKSGKGEDAEGYGIQLIMVIVENLDKAEDEISTFFGDLCGKTPEQFKEMSIEELGEFIAALREVKGLGDFFRSAFKTQKAS